MTKCLFRVYVNCLMLNEFVKTSPRCFQHIRLSIELKIRNDCSTEKYDSIDFDFAVNQAPRSRRQSAIPFLKNKSTEQNLIQAFNFIGNSLNENKYCIGVFFDLKKAFDVCFFDVLIMKLEKMGIKGTALQWFKSYLENRKQFVDINGNFSSEKDIISCILQGSILGPILYFCYINDLYRVTDLLTLMFADDTFCL